jgi:hypothetical protein
VTTRPNLADAALAVSVTTYEVARVPVHIAARLPVVRRLAAEGALVRLRLRSKLEGEIDRVLCSPEVERAIDRALAGRLPDAIARSLHEHWVLERFAAEVGALDDARQPVRP